MTVKIFIQVSPDDETVVGWDVQLLSWNAGHTELINHPLTLTEPTRGKFLKTSGDLPAGHYGVHAAAVDVGRKISVTVQGEPAISTPYKGKWPMVIKVDASVGTQVSDTWWFDIA